MDWGFGYVGFLFNYAYHFCRDVDFTSGVMPLLNKFLLLLKLIMLKMTLWKINKNVRSIKFLININIEKHGGINSMYVYVNIHIKTLIFVHLIQKKTQKRKLYYFCSKRKFNLIYNIIDLHVLLISISIVSILVQQFFLISSEHKILIFFWIKKLCSNSFI